VVAALRETVGQAVQRVTLDITDRLIKATPVDTGFARSNWVPNIGGPAQTSGEFNASPEQQAGISDVIAAYQIEDGPIYISNNTSYIAALNAGSSPQAPPGFVEEAIDEVIG